MNLQLSSLLLLLPSFLGATLLHTYPSPANFQNHMPGTFRGVTDSDLVAFAKNRSAQHYGQYLTVNDLNDIAQITRERGNDGVCPYLGKLLTGTNPEVLGSSSLSMSCIQQAFKGVVTAENFGVLKYKLIQAVQDSEFIAMDAEFSGIEVPAHDDHPGVAPMANFDTRQERYAKLTQIVEHMGLLQVGLAFYTKTSLNTYEASNFSFYLEQPRDLLMSSGAKEALGQFDMTMCYDHGIPIASFAELVYAMKGLNKPLAVYNGTYDLAFLMKNCYGAIPATFDLFKKASHVLFPTVIDIKYIADFLQSNTHTINNKDLESLLNSLPSPTAKLIAPALAQAGFHDAGYDALVTGSTLLSLIDMFGLTNVLANSNIIREGGRTIYKYYSLDGATADHVPSTKFLYTVTSNLNGINSPASKLGADLKSFSSRHGTFSTGCKTDMKNGQLMVMFSCQADVDLFNSSTKFGLSHQGKTPNYFLKKVTAVY